MTNPLIREVRDQYWELQNWENFMDESKKDQNISNVNIQQAFTLASNAVKENPKFYARIRDNWEKPASGISGYCACCGAPHMLDGTQQHDPK